MYTEDIHSNKETVSQALDKLDIALSIARRDKDKILCLIVGYGSKTNKHKIKSAIIDKLDEYLSVNRIKGYILGSDLDIFNEKYQKLPNNYKIPDKEKQEKNPGKIYIIL